MKYIDFTKKIAMMVQWRGAILNIVLEDGKISVRPVKGVSKIAELNSDLDDSVIVLKAYAYQTVRPPLDIVLEDEAGVIASELMTGVISALRVALNDQRASLESIVAKAAKTDVGIIINDVNIGASILKNISKFAELDNALLNNELLNADVVIMSAETVSLGIVNDDEIAAIDAEIASAPSSLFSLTIKLDDSVISADAKAIVAIVSALSIYNEFEIVLNDVLSQGRKIAFDSLLNEQLMTTAATAFRYATIGDYDYYTLDMMDNETLDELDKIYLEVQ